MPAKTGGPFTRQIPAASSGLRKPASAASYANRRTAASRPLIVPAARPRFSRAIRNRVTTTLVDESQVSEQYYSMNSSRACRYPRFNSGERKLSSTAALLWSKSGSPSFVIGLFVFADLVEARLLIVQPSPTRLDKSLWPYAPPCSALHRQVRFKPVERAMFCSRDGRRPLLIVDSRGILSIVVVMTRCRNHQIYCKERSIY